MSGRIKLAFCLATLILLSVSSRAHARIWVDSEGRSVDAEFVSYDASGEVTLRRNDNGKTIKVAFSKFSDDDQRRIKDLRDKTTKTEGNPFTAKPITPDTFQSNPFASAASPSDGEGMQDKQKELLPGEKDASEAEARRELARTRYWTDNQGNRIKAKFVRIFEGNVILLQGNKAQSVDFYKLSDMDQRFLHDQMEILGEGDLLPPILIRIQNNNIDNNGAIANSLFPSDNTPSESNTGPGDRGRPSGLGMGPSGMSSFPPPSSTEPKNNFEAERDRLAREFEEKFAKSSIPAAQPAAREPEKLASNTPAYDPWANQSPSHGSSKSSPAPPKVTPPAPKVRPPSKPSRWPTSPSGRKPSMSGSPLGGDMVWECQTCHTQFDTVEKPSACYFCWSLRIGAFVLISVVGAAIRGAMS
ncbi:SHD1 domain-containing protein [Blastopirellula sp. J2-11]|uniref:SHD1 domain-containing protein n=1 Tax=Blastopirellula sp. J2-11 TaxID=2943192 RepID=UPI0021C84A1E|nr:SHD1 domain-containing protein [Blastopirellula sp. J2-11]UUO04847.1 SHD1 domain-containing protein [Blastopirellula sp. J2-11]